MFDQLFVKNNLTTNIFLYMSYDFENLSCFAKKCRQVGWAWLKISEISERQSTSGTSLIVSLHQAGLSWIGSSAGGHLQWERGRRCNQVLWGETVLAYNTSRWKEVSTNYIFFPQEKVYLRCPKIIESKNYRKFISSKAKHTHIRSPKTKS